MVDRWNRVPDGIEPIVAYRGWYYEIGHERATLRSFTAVPGWEGASRAWVFASCKRPDTGPWHFAPEEQCTCGFYAVKALPHILRWAPMLQGMVAPFQPSTSTETRTGIVFGRVELAGKVIEHELGYRAERARIAELILTRGSEWPVMILSQRLGIPVGEPADVPTMHEVVRSSMPRLRRPP